MSPLLSPFHPSHTHCIGADQGPHSLVTRWTGHKIMIKPRVHRKGRECMGMLGARHNQMHLAGERGGGWPGLQSTWTKGGYRGCSTGERVLRTPRSVWLRLSRWEGRGRGAQPEGSHLPHQGANRASEGCSPGTRPDRPFITPPGSTRRMDQRTELEVEGRLWHLRNHSDG